jgi:hypothetical protein
MATRSAIGIRLNNGKIKAVYCHYDGYPEGVGKTLLEHYDGKTNATKLISLGDISVLDKSMSKPAGHTFNKRVEGYSVFYGRDRGEKNTRAKIYDSVKDIFDNLGSEYVYVLENNQWMYASYEDQELKPLIETMGTGGGVETIYYWEVKLKMPNGEIVYEDVIADSKEDARYYGELTDSAKEGGKVLTVKSKGIETMATGGGVGHLISVESIKNKIKGSKLVVKDYGLNDYFSIIKQGAGRQPTVAEVDKKTGEVKLNWHAENNLEKNQYEILKKLQKESYKMASGGMVFSSTYNMVAAAKKLSNPENYSVLSDKEGNKFMLTTNEKASKLEKEGNWTKFGRINSDGNFRRLSGDSNKMATGGEVGNAKVIGYTQSNKPVYLNKSNERSVNFTRQDHIDAAAIFDIYLGGVTTPLMDKKIKEQRLFHEKKANISQKGSVSEIVSERAKDFNYSGEKYFSAITFQKMATGGGVEKIRNFIVKVDVYDRYNEGDKIKFKIKAKSIFDLLDKLNKKSGDIGYYLSGFDEDEDPAEKAKYKEMPEKELLKLFDESNGDGGDYYTIIEIKNGKEIILAGGIDEYTEEEFEDDFYATGGEISAVEEWVGLEYSKEQIEMVLDALEKAEIRFPEDTKVTNARSIEDEARQTAEMTDDFYYEIEEYCPELSEKEIKEILWGVIYSSKNY